MTGGQWVRRGCVSPLAAGGCAGGRSGSGGVGGDGCQHTFLRVRGTQRASSRATGRGGGAGEEGNRAASPLYGRRRSHNCAQRRWPLLPLPVACGMTSRHPERATSSGPFPPPRRQIGSVGCRRVLPGRRGRPPTVPHIQAKATDRLHCCRRRRRRHLYRRVPHLHLPAAGGAVGAGLGSAASNGGEYGQVAWRGDGGGGGARGTVDRGGRGGGKRGEGKRKEKHGAGGERGKEDRGGNSTRVPHVQYRRTVLTCTHGTGQSIHFTLQSRPTPDRPWSVGGGKPETTRDTVHSCGLASFLPTRSWIMMDDPAWARLLDHPATGPGPDHPSSS